MATAGDVLNQCGGGQRSLRAITQMNGGAIIRLPHCVFIRGHTADGAADGHRTAVGIDRTAIDVLNLRALLHHECAALNPDRTRRADRARSTFASCGA